MDGWVGRIKSEGFQGSEFAEADTPESEAESDVLGEKGGFYFRGN